MPPRRDSSPKSCGKEPTTPMASTGSRPAIFTIGRESTSWCGIGRTSVRHMDMTSIWSRLVWRPDRPQAKRCPFVSPTLVSGRCIGRRVGPNMVHQSPILPIATTCPQVSNQRRRVTCLTNMLRPPIWGWLSEASIISNAPAHAAWRTEYTALEDYMN